MADGVELRVDLPAFKRQLQALGRDMERRIVRAACAAAARIFRKAAQDKAPVLRTPKKGRTAGTLRRNIYIKRSRDSTRGREHYFVGVRQGKRQARAGRDAFYWRFLEGGWIPRGPGRRLRGGRRSVALQRSRLAASGARRVSYPFLGPAFRENRDRALRAFYDRIERRIEQANRDQAVRR